MVLYAAESCHPRQGRGLHLTSYGSLIKTDCLITGYQMTHPSGIPEAKPAQQSLLTGRGRADC